MKMTINNNKTTNINLAQYEEAILIMMRHGGALDKIAIAVGTSEDHLLSYLNDKGIIEKLKNRSWTYKSKGKKRNIVKRKKIQYKVA